MASTDRLLDGCAQALVELAPRLMDELRRHMRAGAPVGMSVPQMRMLIHAQAHGGASLTALAERLGVTLPTVSVAAQRLVRDGWLEIRPDPKDKRRNAVWLTPDGEAVVKRARQHTRARFADRLRDSDAATLSALGTSLAALAEMLGTPTRSASDRATSASLVAPAPCGRTTPTDPTDPPCP